VKPRQNGCARSNKGIGIDPHTATQRGPGRDVNAIVKDAFVIDNHAMIQDDASPQNGICRQRGLCHHMAACADNGRGRHKCARVSHGWRLHPGICKHRQNRPPVGAARAADRHGCIQRIARPCVYEFAAGLGSYQQRNTFDYRLCVSIVVNQRHDPVVGLKHVAQNAAMP
jgi:hypothetical protein